MGKTSDNQGVDYFLGKSKCFGHPCTAFCRIIWVNYPIISVLIVIAERVNASGTHASRFAMYG